MLHLIESYVTSLTQVFWREFWIATTTLIFASRVSNTRSPSFYTLTIRDYTYYDGHFYVISGVSYYTLIFTVKYFLQEPQHLRLTNWQWWSFISKFNKSGIKIFSHTQLLPVDSRIVDINVGYGSHCQWLWFPSF